MSKCLNPKECCDELTRVWAVLGNPEFDGRSCSEHVKAVIDEPDRAYRPCDNSSGRSSSIERGEVNPSVSQSEQITRQGEKPDRPDQLQSNSRSDRILDAAVRLSNAASAVVNKSSQDGNRSSGALELLLSDLSLTPELLVELADAAAVGLCGSQENAWACIDCGCTGHEFTCRKSYTDCGYEYDVICDHCQSDNTAGLTEAFPRVVDERDRRDAKFKALEALLGEVAAIGPFDSHGVCGFCCYSDDHKDGCLYLLIREATK